jgi:deoxyribodipyrimidine photolyase
MTDEERARLEEERIRLLHLRYGEENEEVKAWVAEHGSIPEEVVQPETTSDSVIVVTEAQPVDVPVVERSRRAERAEKIE